MNMNALLRFAGDIQRTDFSDPENHFCVVGYAAAIMTMRKVINGNVNGYMRYQACLAQTGVDCCRESA